MSKQPLVWIESANKTVPLSKQQKRLNQLTSRITEQEEQLAELRAATEQVRQRIQGELVPLQRKQQQARADLVRLLDQLHERYAWSNAESRKLRHLITSLAYDLIQQGYGELKPIYDRYDEAGFEAVLAETDAVSMAQIRHIAEARYGLLIDPAQSFATPDELLAHVQGLLRERALAEQQRQQEAADRRAQEPKTEKQQAREARAIKVTKAVRALYLDLVKAFHPDRELEPAEKERKTAIMQRVTEAYEKSDLMGLFRLQLEFDRIDQKQLAALADSQLQHYNKILTQQVEELDGQLATLTNELKAMLGSSAPGPIAVRSLDYVISGEIKAAKADTKSLRALVKALADPAQLKVWLSAYPNP
ncbi:heat shock protein DnaJ domain-containing protein [Fibrella aestuarina BUZ 2]|uniref:Heat shock protein DnaJ domain-containing protein n=1 Tax=Fibrella aestuarina BUZ 2 TaxID=1166018 RepID=I0K9Y5_9BACT|nr:molecular chaperone DnaJ [Fibrella aestuarina]CCH00938.1 heat shock protein DnaJ domain-containing protein [Fibrella aestuarina BUZ 2]